MRDCKVNCFSIGGQYSERMISLSQISMSFGNKLLFYDVNLLLNDNKHYALVGANGTGKSTFLKLITGEEHPLSGTISIPKDATIGWLKQDQYRYEESPLVDVVLQGKPQLWNAMQEKEQLLMNTEWDEKAGYRLGELEELIAHAGGYTAETFAIKLLKGLGIAEEYHRQPLKVLSGGYKLRVLLAQALFQEPTILLLDEPTNHLDIISIRWLENYLQQEYRGLVIFISHDVDFVDRLADHILDIDYGEINVYSGNYQKFLSEKNQIAEQRLHLKKSMEDRMAVLQKFVDRFSAGTRAKQAQSKAKQLEKIEPPDIKQSSRVAPYFNFKINRPSGKHILKAENLSKKFKEKQLFQNVNFSIDRSEKLVIVGENGIGKSTLIKSLLGIIQPDEGKVEWGYEAQKSYFSQDHHDLLKTHMSALHWLNAQASTSTEQTIRKTLGQVLFSQDDVNKDILSLSGGEAARLLLARMMLENGNILILDEPTNHMDLESIEALADALNQYPGTLIAVSHNRHFISKIASRILMIRKNKPIIDFKGNYQTFESIYLHE